MEQKGFTLIEIVITMVILSLVMLTAWGAFEVGFRARDKGEAVARRSQQMRLATDVIGRQLRSAVYYFARYEGELYPFFSGQTTEMSFVTSYPQGQAGNGLAWVTYRLEDDRLLMVERVGFRPDELYTPEESENQGLRAVLLEGLGGLRFQYAPREEEGEEWEDRWDGREEESIPALVRLTAEGVAFFKAAPWVQEIPLLTMASGWGIDEFEEPPEEEEEGSLANSRDLTAGDDEQEEE